LGHGAEVIQPGVVVLERRNHGKDGFPFLIRLNPSGGKRSAIVNPICRERDGLGDISWTEEIAVQRVNSAPFGNGVHRG